MTEAPPLVPPTRLTLDLDAVVANRRAIVERVGEAVEVAGVVKADAYGVGLEPAARALVGDGCRTFFVAHVGEGIALRAVLDGARHPETRIFVLNGLAPGNECAYAAHRLSPVLGSLPEVADWTAFRAASRTMVGAALHVDTGMNRHGLSLAEARALAADPSAVEAAGATLLMSHLACADEPAHPLNAVQLARFREIRGLFPGLSASLANSAGVFLDAAYHFDLVRPGIALYGGAIVSGEPTPMRMVARLEASILQVRDVPAGESIGYGARETVRRPTRLAVLSVGYADGFHRLASSADGAPGGRGVLAGRSVPIVGRISMDLLVVDVTDVPEAQRGATVELIGDTVTLQEVAARMGTIDYEVLTALGHRYTRVHRGG
jgi:alanine racemase